MTRPIVIACPNLSLDRTMRVSSIALGRVHRSESADVRGGGKGVNVARALRGIGVPATVIGLAAGHTGEAVLGLLADEEIDIVAVQSEGETRSCLTVIADRAPTVFNEPGPPVDGATWERYETAVRDRMTPESVFVCSGSFPLRAPESGAARLAAGARALGCRVVCDTSRAQLANALGAAPDVVSPNLSEAETLLAGSEEESVEAGEHALARAAAAGAALCARGPGAALVSAGAAGAVLTHGGGTTLLSAHTISAVNPVGAGDCLVAGVAEGYATGRGLVESARRGMAMAAAGCETLAAGAFERDRFEQLLRSGVGPVQGD